MRLCSRARAVSLASLFLVGCGPRLVAPPTGAVANAPAPPPAPPAPSSPRRVSLTIAGGVSLGAYEAGVNFAIVAGLRRMRARHEAVLEVATGASAGSINAVLTAVSYCKRDHETVRDNVFARSWLDVGWQRLFPGEKSCAEYAKDAGVSCTGTPYSEEDGLFSRRGLALVEEQLAKDLANGAQFDPTCSIRVGATVTREDTVSVTIPGGLETPTQRFAVLLDARPNGALGLEFRHVVGDAKGVAALVGERLDLGTLGGATAAQGPRVPHDALLAMLEAASAFPVAFGMKQLTFCAEYAGAGEDGATHCKRWERKRFFDGGLYDNIPLGIAAYLMQTSAEKGPSDAPTYLYIDPDRIRREPTHVAAPKGSSEGLPLLLQLVGKFVTVSRKYELQGVARVAGDSVKVRPVTRLVPIMGEHFLSFGAFLAKAFRRYDYYVGIYDGLYTLAERRCAEEDAKEPKDPLGWAADPKSVACIVRQVRALHDEIGLGTEDEEARSASAVVRALLRREAAIALGSPSVGEGFLAAELGDWPVAPVVADPFTAKLLEENLALDRDLRNPDKPEQSLGVEDFYRVTASLHPVAQTYAGPSDDERRLFKNPESWVFRAGKALALRALDREKENGDGGAGKVVFGGLAFGAHLVSPKWVGDPTWNADAMPDCCGPRDLIRLLPYDVMWHAYGQGVELGHRIGAHLGRGWWLGANVRALSKTDSALSWKVGPQLRSPELVLATVDVSVFAKRRWSDDPDVKFGAELGLSFLYRLFRVSVSFDELLTPAADFRRSFAPTFRVGIQDIPSLVYWGKRSIF